MRHMFSLRALAVLLTLAAILSATSGLSAADKAAPVKADPPKKAMITAIFTPSTSACPAVPSPSPAPKAMTTLEKLKNFGAQAGRTLALAADLFSGNEADLLSKNNTALLSGNSPAVLSGNSPALLSGNAPKVLSDNKTPILSGNTFSVLSNIKVEVHIQNSGNNNTTGSSGQPPKK